MKSLNQLKIKIFADGADRESMLKMYANPLIQGFTTNPTLMHKAGIKNYEHFALDILNVIRDKPVSLEVFADDFEEMNRQALKIAAWQENVYVKIPITNSKGDSSIPLIRHLAQQGIKQNITAVMTLDQVKETAEALAEAPPSLISIYAGRVADTGYDPTPLMEKSVESLGGYPHLQLMWASSRELLNIFQAEQSGCHIITLSHDLIQKFGYIGKDLHQFSIETVKMLHDAACAAEYTL